MSDKTDVIAFVTANLVAQAPVREKVIEIVSNCEENGVLRKLNTAYSSHSPTVKFEDNPNAESGAYYDTVKNELLVKPQGDAGERADMFLFESFNCFHREDYKGLDLAFRGSSYPPMYFMDYGRRKSDIEGKATYGYLQLLREVQRTRATYPFVRQAKQALKKNEGVVSEDQMMASMTWTPHDPGGVGDFQFASPRHYAFQKALDLTKAQADFRIKHLVVNAAIRDGSRFYETATKKRRAYGGRIDSNGSFQRWWASQWDGLRRTQKPTAFISICEKGNQVLRGNTVHEWRPIKLADYQFDTGMELEARRLCKNSPLVGSP